MYKSYGSTETSSPVISVGPTNAGTAEAERFSAEMQKQYAAQEASVKAQQAKAEAELADLVAKSKAAEDWASQSEKAGVFLFDRKNGLQFAPSVVGQFFAEALVQGDEQPVKIVEKAIGYTVFNPGDGSDKIDAKAKIKAGAALLLQKPYKGLNDPKSKPLMAIANDAPSLAKLAASDFGILVAPASMVAEAEKIVAVNAVEKLVKRKPLTKSDDTWSRVNRVGQVVVGTAAIYHGYKRNNSIGWALVWGLLGTTFWPIAAPLMAAQGFGEPEKK